MAVYYSNDSIQSWDASPIVTSGTYLLQVYVVKHILVRFQNLFYSEAAGSNKDSISCCDNLPWH